MLQNDRYFDHDADIGIIGRGNSLAECFVDAAKSVFTLMSGDLSNIKPYVKVSFDFKEDDVELAFVTWLNLLIGQAQAENLIFSQFQMSNKDGCWYGEAQGEKWRDDIERGIDVKGATLTMLSVKQENGKWEARCVVDV